VTTGVTSVESRASRRRLPSTRVVAFARRHRGRLELVAAGLVYFAFACHFTWPMVRHIGSVWYGGIGDPIGSISTYTELVTGHHNPFLPGVLSQLAAPEGQPISWTRNLAAFPSITVNYVLADVFGAFVAYNLYIFIAFVGTGTVMFAFVRRLVGNAWIALICGWAYAFYPFAMLNAGGHADYAHGWVLVLMVWRMIEMHWRPTTRNALLAGAAAALAMWWTPYFLLIGGAGYVAALIGSVLVQWRERRLRPALRAHLVAAVIVGVFLVFVGALSLGPTGTGEGVRTNNLAQFNAYSARPLEYVVPDIQSPLFGSDTSHYLVTHLHGSNFAESTLYLGVTVVVLALIALIVLARRRLDPRLAGATVIVAVVAVVALICSAPPRGEVLGINVPFPSAVIMHVTSTWRAYSRFVVLVMLAATLLAGVGLHALIAGRRLPVRVLVLVLAAVVVPLDLWSTGSGTNTNAVPADYTFLAHQPRGLTAEYPLVPAIDDDFWDIYYQSVHHMPMINGYGSGSLGEQRAVSLSNLAVPATAPRLAALGVRYIIRESAPPQYGLPSPGVPGRGFEKLFTAASGTVYRVTARPSGPALPTISTGFFAAEKELNGTEFNWLGASAGTIELAGGCPGCHGILEMTVASFARPRLVTIEGAGRVLLRRWVSHPVSLRLPLRAQRVENVTMTTAPGPQSIHATTGAPDPRSVSIQVSSLRYVWAPGQRVTGG
jgi:hypothetical protein